ncbi:MAG: QacE family quaternary ammonium compound efflux SMR transporter [Candidatus Pelagibacter sp.]|nr:QacE family quaternary ammonium compound efflux SMR transporter [Candidatus Pelagibacter sp.]|tara:strand:- start:5902 stop:6237 length:336 start_codon:yes stop_codon:yes gene_type:complete
MKPFVGYLILALGISTGIAANSLAKVSDGFTKLTPTIACLGLMCITMFSLAKAMSVIPVAFSYSTYSGLTVAGVVLFGVLKYNQVPNLYGFIGICLIVIGVIMVNYLGRTS